MSKWYNTCINSSMPGKRTLIGNSKQGWLVKEINPKLEVLVLHGHLKEVSLLIECTHQFTGYYHYNPKLVKKIESFYYLDIHSFYEYQKKFRNLVFYMKIIISNLSGIITILIRILASQMNGASMIVVLKKNSKNSILIIRVLSPTSLDSWKRKMSLHYKRLSQCITQIFFLVINKYWMQ